MRRVLAVMLAVVAVHVAAPTAVASAADDPPTTQWVISRHPTYDHCNVTGAAGKVKGWWRTYACVYEPRPDPDNPWALHANGI